MDDPVRIHSISADQVFDILKEEHPFKPWKDLKSLVLPRLQKVVVEKAKTSECLLIDDNRLDILKHVNAIPVLLYTPLQTLAQNAKGRNGGDRRPFPGILEDFADFYVSSSVGIDEICTNDIIEFLNQDPSNLPQEKINLMAKKASKKMNLPVNSPHTKLQIMPRFDHFSLILTYSEASVKLANFIHSE